MDLINDEKQVDISALTFSQLAKKFGTGQAYTISGEGRNRKTGYRSGVMTEIGNIEECLWERLVYKLIVLHNEQHIFEKLLTWYKNHPCYRTAPEQRKQALELHAGRYFEKKDWVGYAEFNKN